MDIQAVIEKINLYGPFIIFGLLYLEALNLSGIPATVLMPAIGFYIGQGKYSFVLIFVIALLAGALGNLTYYWLAFKLGAKMYHKTYNKFPSAQKPLKQAMYLSEKYGDKACLVGRLIPGVRAFVSIIPGIFRMKFRTFAVYSILGIAVWDFATLLIGYYIYLQQAAI